MTRLAAMLMVILLVPAALKAQVLADKVPANALVYVGFKGSNALAAEYGRSHLKGMLDATDLDTLVSSDFARSVATLVRRENPEMARQIVPMFAAARQMWQYPTALTMWADADGQPALWLMCDAGKDADALMKQLKLAAPTADVRMAGSLVMLSARAPGKQAAAAGPMLAAAPAFQAAMKQVNPDAAAVLFVNAGELLNLWKRDVRDPDIARVRAAMGFDGIKYLAASGVFSEQNWTGQVFVAAPAPRIGVALLLDGRPLSPGLMKLVPASAAQVSAFGFDFAAALEQLRSAVKQSDANMSEKLEQGLVASRSILQVDIAKDLFPALGNEWVWYNDASVGSIHPLAYVGINVLRNAEQAEKSLSTMQNAILGMANTALMGQKMSLRASEKQYGNTKVHTVALPMVAPSWAVRDGKLYIAAYPQLVVAAADLAAGNGKSFADNAQLAAMQKRLGITAQSVSYCDMQQLAATGYGTAMLLTHYSGFADMFGLPMPVMAIPPLPELQKYLSPMLSVTWSDAAGWHMEQTSPFPGSLLLATALSPQLSSMQGPLAVSILLPSLTRGREKANQIKCASNMRQIGQGIMIFANDNKGRYPDDLGEMLVSSQLSTEVFVCPSSALGVPDAVRKAPPEQQAEWVINEGSYIYLGEGLKTGVNADFILAYEPMEDHGEGCNVLFADGHVEFVTPDRFQQALGEARKSGQLIPEVMQD